MNHIGIAQALRLLTLTGMALLQAACGGGGGGSPGDTTPPTPNPKPLTLERYAGGAVPNACAVVDGVANAATLCSAPSMAADASGNLYFIDGLVVRKLAPNGQVTTIAGKAGETGPVVDGTADKARFNFPRQLALSGSLIYVVDLQADLTSAVIRRIDAAGNVSSLATLYREPRSIAADSRGNLFITGPFDGDLFNNILRMTPGGVISLWATASNAVNLADFPPWLGSSPATAFSTLDALRVDSQDNLWVVKTQAYGAYQSMFQRTFNYRSALLSYSPDGTPLNLPVAFGDATHRANIAGIPTSFSLVGLDANGDVVLTDNSLEQQSSPGLRLYTVTRSGTFVGKREIPYTVEPSTSTSAIATGLAGLVYFSRLNQINAVSPTGDVRRVAGKDWVADPVPFEGQRLQTTMTAPTALALNSQGDLLVADKPSFNGSELSVRTLNSAGTVSSTTFSSGANVYQFAAVDDAHLLSVNFGCSVDALDISAQLIATAAGDRAVCASSASDISRGLLGRLGGIARAPDGTLYVSETNNHRVIKITPSGQASVLAGQFGVSGQTDGGASAAKLLNPKWLFLDTVGNLLVVEDSVGRVRRVTPAGQVSTLAVLDSTPNIRAAAKDASDNLYLVADAGVGVRSSILKLSPDGRTTPLPLQDQVTGFGHSMQSADLLSRVRAIAVGNKTLYLSLDQDRVIGRITGLP